MCCGPPLRASRGASQEAVSGMPTLSPDTRRTIRQRALTLILPSVGWFCSCDFPRPRDEIVAYRKSASMASPAQWWIKNAWAKPRAFDRTVGAALCRDPPKHRGINPLLHPNQAETSFRELNPKRSKSPPFHQLSALHKPLPVLYELRGRVHKLRGGLRALRDSLHTAWASLHQLRGRWHHVRGRLYNVRANRTGHRTALYKLRGRLI